MKVRRILAAAAVAAAVAIPAGIVAPASAGGRCNPGNVDLNCTYTYGGDGKDYFCSVWTGSGCLADVGSQQVQR